MPYKNKEERKEYQKRYDLLHKKEIKIKSKNYALEHKDEIRGRKRKWERNKYTNDPIYKRRLTIRAIFRHIVFKIITNGNITEQNDITCLKLFGTTVDGFKKHIENQFTDSMSWHNHGNMDNPDAWQLDHIIPTSSFDFTVEENFTKAFHYTNTQPLMSSDHLEKSNKEPKR